MNKSVFFLLLVFILFFPISCISDVSSAHQLAERIVPKYAKDIVFYQIEDTLDVFEILSKDGKLIIKGNNANSMAVGLNYYLKNYCAFP